MKSEFTISHKKRMQDSVCIYGKYYKVSGLIESNPMLLWNAIHNNKKNIKKNIKKNDKKSEIYKGKALSLVRPVYDLLKKNVANIAPEEVATVEQKFEQNKRSRKMYKLEQKLQQEIKSGKIDSRSSRFKKM